MVDAGGTAGGLFVNAGSQSVCRGFLPVGGLVKMPARLLINELVDRMEDNATHQWRAGAQTPITHVNSRCLMVGWTKNILLN
jgi:hypothetical protein